jgi:ABC-2 type transport system ATP-binding protein
VLSEDATDGVEVSSRIHGPTPKLFRSGVSKGPDEVARARELSVLDGVASGDSKVEDDDPPIPAHQNVRWLEVAVNDSGPVDTTQGVEQLDGPMANGVEVVPTRPRERLTVDELHDQQMTTGDGLIIDDTDHAGHPQQSQGADLSTYASRESLVGSDQDLQGDVLAEQPIVREVDDAEPTLAESPKDLVACWNLDRDCRQGGSPNRHRQGGCSERCLVLMHHGRSLPRKQRMVHPWGKPQAVMVCPVRGRDDLQQRLDPSPLPARQVPLLSQSRHGATLGFSARQPRPAPTPGASLYAIEATSLVIRYSNGHVALDGLSLAISRGSFFGLLGPNGAGKSSFIGAIGGLVVPTSGTVNVLGLDAVKDRSAVARKLGIVPQSLALYADLTVRDNLRFFGGLYGLHGEDLAARSHMALGVAQLADREGSRVGSLSGGMARRLNLAVALLHDPEVIICDEPTTGVDPQSRLHLFEALRRLHAGGKTVVYTTHYMEEVETLCREVAIVDQGRLVTRGTLDALLAPGEGKLPTAVTVTLPIGVRESDVRNQLNALGIAAHDVKPIRATLEDVFMAHTGRALRDGEP